MSITLHCIIIRTTLLWQFAIDTRRKNFFWFSNLFNVIVPKIVTHFVYWDQYILYWGCFKMRIVNKMPMNCSISRLIMFIVLPVFSDEYKLLWTAVILWISKDISKYSWRDRHCCGVSGNGSPVKLEFRKWGGRFHQRPRTSFLTLLVWFWSVNWTFQPSLLVR